MPDSPAAAPSLLDTVARLSAPGGYCSGTLIDPETVLTCSHFFRGRDTAHCRVAGQHRRVAQVRRIPGTDLALVTLDRPITDVDSFPELGPPPAPLTEVVTFGYGGGARTPAGRVGRFLTQMPLAVSRGMRTVVKPAGLIYNTVPAVRGDSGGPVFADGRIVAVQSLILDPQGVNLRLATVALVGPASSRWRPRRVE